MHYLEPIRQTLIVEADQERTFLTFVRQLAAWWPIGTRALTSSEIRDVRVEEQFGGRIYEIHLDGTESDWGRVTLWKPPEAFSFTWEVTPCPESTEVGLEFQRLGPALTRVVVEHHGWERLGTALIDRYPRFAGGWRLALSRFAAMFPDAPSGAATMAHGAEPDTQAKLQRRNGHTP